MSRQFLAAKKSNSYAAAEQQQHASKSSNLYIHAMQQPASKHIANNASSTEISLPFYARARNIMHADTASYMMITHHLRACYNMQMIQ